MEEQEAPPQLDQTQCLSFYQALQTATSSILEESFNQDARLSLSKSHSFIDDLGTWARILSSRPEAPVWLAAKREYEFSLLMLIQGQYRYSFVALRLFLEMAIASIGFSAHEVRYRLWMRGEHDIKWHPLVEDEAGVLSTSFIRAFCEQLSDEAKTYRLIAQKVYRECSEFVHGNASTHEILAGPLKYSQDVVDSWHDKADSIRLVVSFLLCARYIHFLKRDDLHTLEPLLLDALGHLAAVRGILGSTIN